MFLPKKKTKKKASEKQNTCFEEKMENSKIDFAFKVYIILRRKKNTHTYPKLHLHLGILYVKGERTSSGILRPLRLIAFWHRIWQILFILKKYCLLLLKCATLADNMVGALPYYICGLMRCIYRLTVESWCKACWNEIFNHPYYLFGNRS